MTTERTTGGTAAGTTGETATGEAAKVEIRDGMLVEWDVPVRMDDGVVLRADVYRPPDATGVPVILNYGPYAKGLAFQDGYPDQWEKMCAEHPDVPAGSSNAYQTWEAADPEKWVPDGYACVRVDSRGTGRSPGYLDPFSPRETRDFSECIEWAGTRPWSNGRVGLAGISYYAINQWHVASLQPPHLAAICPWEGAADFYRDKTHHGGILSTFMANWYPRQVLNVQHGLGDRGRRSRVTGETIAGPETLDGASLEANRTDLGATIRAHPLDDAFHRERSPDWSKVTVPLLSAANWGGQGLHPRGNFEGFNRAASTRKWLEVHGLEHWTHFYTDYGVKLQKRFFGHFLKGEDTGWGEQPPVLLQVRTVDGGFVERAEENWPLERTRWTRWYLDPERQALTTTPVTSGSVSFEAPGEGVTFAAPPVTEETEITGPVAARLLVSSSTTDADLFLVLRAFTPDGEEVVFNGAVDPRTPLAQGWLRASHRKLDPALSRPDRPYHTHDERQPLRPGEVYAVDVEIWPTSVILPAGYQLRLTVLGRDFAHAEGAGARLGNFGNELRGSGPFLHDDPEDRPEDVFGGVTTLHAAPAGGGDDHPYLLLPVIPPGRGPRGR